MPQHLKLKSTPFYALVNTRQVTDESSTVMFSNFSYSRAGYVHASMCLFNLVQASGVSDFTWDCHHVV